MNDTDQPKCPFCEAVMFWTGWGWKCKRHVEFKPEELIYEGDEEK